MPVTSNFGEVKKKMKATSCTFDFENPDPEALGEFSQ
jgi:hypothetical protein